jgi:hypothetical protein
MVKYSCNKKHPATKKGEVYMHRMIQLSFADTHEKCANLFEDRKPEYIKILTNINNIEYYLCLSYEKNNKVFI